MSDSRNRGSRSILVVDDEDRLRLLVRKILEVAHYEVAEAATATEALKKLLVFQPDLILLDFILPDMTGLLLLNVIRSKEQLAPVPVVFLTGTNDSVTKAAVLESGAVDYVTKPFDRVELLARIARHIEIKDQREEQARKAADAAASAQRALETAEQRFRVMVQNSVDLVCELDGQGRIVYSSPNHEEILGYPPDALLGRSWAEFVHPGDAKELNLKLPINSHLDWRRLTFRFQNSDRDWRWLEVSGSALPSDNGATRLLLVSRDVTQVKQTEERLAEMALRDSLTSLGNRQRFSQELSAMSSDPNGADADALMFVDIDDFKMVNDTQGHLAGDEVLRLVADAFRRVFGNQHLICRVGGDEFCVILRGVTVEQAISLGWRLIEEVRVCSAGPTGIGVTVSAGLAMVESNRKSDELIGRADSALYAAKDAGKNQVRLFRADSPDLVTIRTEMEWFPRIKTALREHQFEVSYQPIIALETGRLVCNEALIRYSGPDGNTKLPAQFLPAAERYFLMPEVDQYVLDCVLEYLITNREWRISVNLSGQSISSSGRIKQIKQRLLETDINPNNLVFEITESVFIENLNRVSDLVSELSGLGCRFWLDDFGTGYSSLSYLRQLPVDTVKIDGSFVRGVTTDPVARSLLKSINDIAHLLDKKTVAEFIDSPSIVPVLRELGIDYAQGFLFGVPGPISVEASR